MIGNRAFGTLTAQKEGQKMMPALVKDTVLLKAICYALSTFARKRVYRSFIGMRHDYVK
jgi:hypothetical protein